MDIGKGEITAVKIKNKLSYPEARRVVSSRTPVSGKKLCVGNQQDIRINSHSGRRKSTAPKSAQSDSVKSKPIAVDTSVYPSLLLKDKKARIKRNRGAITQKGGRTSLKKLHDMGDDVMDIHL
ncbi:hypothetical protein TNCV_2048801 [Trichonephila clavipes]|nr:hypothetical protein TNCV_2048801 [Trichonephila clavipes]